MKKETIVYKNQNYHRYPSSSRRPLRVYYWRHDKWKSPPFALHRQIWIDAHGPIPKGYVVHHKDGNPLNNDISNLEALSKTDHMKHHPNPKHKENGKNFFQEAVEQDCLECGKPFMNRLVRKVKFCSRLCGGRNWRKSA